MMKTTHKVLFIAFQGRSEEDDEDDAQGPSRIPRAITHDNIMTLAYVSLVGQQLGDRVADILSDHHLVKLDLSFNSITRLGAISLSLSSTLVEIRLVKNKIDIYGALALAEGSLRTDVDVRQNPTRLDNSIAINVCPHFDHIHSIMYKKQ